MAVALPVAEVSRQSSSDRTVCFPSDETDPDKTVSTCFLDSRPTDLIHAGPFQFPGHKETQLGVVTTKAV